MYQNFIEKINRVLSGVFREMALYTCDKKLVDQEYYEKTGKKKFTFRASYMDTGDEYEYQRQMQAIQKDLQTVEFKYPKRTLCFIFLGLFNRYIEDNEMYEKYVEEIFFKKENREAIINAPTAESGFVSFVKHVGPLIDELFTLMESGKSYLVLKKYAEIIDILNRWGIPPTYDDAAIQEELNKRYVHYSQRNNLKLYKKRVLNPEFKIKDDYHPETFVRAANYYDESLVLQKLLHKIMLNYYKQTGCMFRQFDANFNLYFLGDIIIVAYKFDDAAQTTIKDYHSYEKLSWKDRDFWVKMLDPKLKFEEGSGVNYYLESENGTEQYKVSSSTLEHFSYIFGNKKVILAPEEHLDEAFYKSLTENAKGSLDLITSSKLQAIGFNLDDCGNELLSPDYHFYYKKITNLNDLDNLKVGNLSLYRNLKQLLTKTEAVSRKRSFATICATSKRKQKEKEIEREKAKAESQTAYRQPRRNNSYSYNYGRKKPWWND